MGGFSSVGEIVLQSWDLIGYSFQFPVAASTNVKGSIPYGTTISTVVVTVYDEDDLDVTSDIVHGLPSLISDDTVNVVFKYPVTNGEGKYKATFFLTLSNNQKKEFDFSRLVAKNT